MESIVDDDNLAHPGSRKIEQGGGTKPTGTEYSNPCRLQLQLPRHADFGQNQLTRVEGDVQPRSTGSRAPARFRGLG